MTCVQWPPRLPVWTIHPAPPSAVGFSVGGGCGAHLLGARRGGHEAEGAHGGAGARAQAEAGRRSSSAAGAQAHLTGGGFGHRVERGRELNGKKKATPAGSGSCGCGSYAVRAFEPRREERRLMSFGRRLFINAT